MRRLVEVVVKVDVEVGGQWEGKGFEVGASAVATAGRRRSMVATWVLLVKAVMRARARVEGGMRQWWVMRQWWLIRNGRIGSGLTGWWSTATATSGCI